jgi:hypothetical protein
MARQFTAIDPLYLLLRHDIYVLLTLPDPPPIDIKAARETFSQLNEAEKVAAVARVRAFTTYVNGVREAIGA